MRRSCCGVRHGYLLICLSAWIRSPQLRPGEWEGEEVTEVLGTVPLLEMVFQCLRGTRHPQLPFCSGDGHRRCGRTWALSPTSVLVPAEVGSALPHGAILCPPTVGPSC